MKKLVIQIQPLLDKRFSSDELVSKLQELDLSPRHGKYSDDGEYENITLESTDLKSLWNTVKELFYGECNYSNWLKQVSIVTCHGAHGWDDYLLLHHFDASQTLDILDQR